MAETTRALAVQVPGLADTSVRGYRQCITANGFVFLAGQVGWDESGNLVSKEFEPQARQVFENVRKGLAAAGAGWDDVVMMTTYFTDMQYITEFRRIRQEAMGESMTTHTLLGIDALAHPDMLIEIQVVAVVPR